jgi:hypothetical protein
MDSGRWRWLLPLGQLVVAVACHVYEPHQHRETAQRDRAVNNIEYSFQHSPAPVGVISRGINFPALVLAYPWRSDGDALYSWNSDFTLIWIGTNDVAFFLGITVFWYWFARELNRSETRNPTPKRSRYARLAGLACGTIVGVLAGVYSTNLIGSPWRPERQIGGFGMAWTPVLIIYFTRRLAREFKTYRAQDSLLNPLP